MTPASRRSFFQILLHSVRNGKNTSALKPCSTAAATRGPRHQRTQNSLGSIAWWEPLIGRLPVSEPLTGSGQRGARPAGELIRNQRAEAGMFIKFQKQQSQSWTSCFRLSAGSDIAAASEAFRGQRQCEDLQSKDFIGSEGLY